jgi:hypothetical protein
MTSLLAWVPGPNKITHAVEERTAQAIALGVCEQIERIRL